MKFVRLAGAAGAGVIALGLVSCSSTGGRPADTGGAGGSGGGVNTPRVTIAMITHAAPGDTFWDLIRKGAQAAADKDNIELKYSSDKEGPNQANLVQNATDSKVAGMAVTLAQPDAMKDAVKGAVAAGIPVVALNAGIEQWQDMGVLDYFGQDERISGEAAGKRLAADGAKKAICVVQEQGSVSLEARCAGVKAGLGGGSVENLNVNGTDMPSVQSTITAKLQTDPSIDHIVDAGSAIRPECRPVGQGRGEQGQGRDLRYQRGLGRGNQGRQRAVGYRPAALPAGLSRRRFAVACTSTTRTSSVAASRRLTGPSFIDKTNIDSVAALAQAGTR